MKHNSMLVMVFIHSIVPLYSMERSSPLTSYGQDEPMIAFIHTLQTPPKKPVAVIINNLSFWQDPDFNKEDTQGVTRFMYAVGRGDVLIVRAMLDKGARVLFMTTKGNTVFDLLNILISFPHNHPDRFKNLMDIRTLCINRVLPFICLVLKSSGLSRDIYREIIHFVIGGTLCYKKDGE